jgi:hypothetical protein
MHSQELILMGPVFLTVKHQAHLPKRFVLLGDGIWEYSTRDDEDLFHDLPILYHANRGFLCRTACFLRRTYDEKDLSQVDIDGCTCCACPRGIPATYSDPSGRGQSLEHHPCHSRHPQYHFGAVALCLQKDSPVWLCPERHAGHHRNHHNGSLFVCSLARTPYCGFYPNKDPTGRYLNPVDHILNREGALRTGDFWIRSGQAQKRHQLSIPQYGMVVCPPGRRKHSLHPWPSIMEVADE